MPVATDRLFVVGWWPVRVRFVAGSWVPWWKELKAFILAYARLFAYLLLTMRRQQQQQQQQQQQRQQQQRQDTNNERHARIVEKGQNARTTPY
ncbi:hypothetical protein M0802_002836 [Mischocyttarus mexicanus]|nr:hypothetical protein M0802_002836 [Mischocyttarus mexicanus]